MFSFNSTPIFSENKILFVFLLFAIVGNKLYAQYDSTKLPFAIAHEKRLPEEELKIKKEGRYITGVPDISSDPIAGWGLGAVGSIYNNGKKTDPFFAYTPYRVQLNLIVFITTHMQREIMFNLDVPYIFNTKWRLRAGGGYDANPNLLYFGVGEKTVQPLSYYPNNNPANVPVNHASYSDYKKSQTGSKAFYNTYTEKGALLTLSMERSFNEGRTRILLGYEIASINESTPLNDSALLHKDAVAKKIQGFGQNIISIEQAGLIHDTRDVEADPSKGVFAEFTEELSLVALGSAFNFNKAFIHYNLYRPVLPQIFKRVTFAGRIGFGYTYGNAPFYEYQDEWSSEVNIIGLGGGYTLRGYKQSRFLARAMQFTNLELRCRFAKVKFLKQDLAFSAVPFFDAGGVWDSFKRLNHLENLRYAEGLGLRIAWNVNSVIRLDYAMSKEDRQFFFTVGQMF